MSNSTQHSVLVRRRWNKDGRPDDMVFLHSDGYTTEETRKYDGRTFTDQVIDILHEKFNGEGWLSPGERLEVIKVSEAPDGAWVVVFFNIL